MESYMQQCTSVATMSFSAVVLFYEGFLYNAVFLKRILPTLGRGAQVIPLAILFNSFYIMAVWSYFKAHLTNPGTVPERWHEWVRNTSHNLPVFAAVPQWQPGKVTYCKMCDKTRPERAHHCHNCGICVLRFDHHCLWINNCVGINNHKHFLLVGIYCCVGLLIALATSFPELAYCAVTAFQADDPYALDDSIRLPEKVAFLVFGLLGFSVCTLLAAMLFVHLPRAAQNITAPEANYSNMPNPFSRGDSMGNLEQIFGVFGPDWFFPVDPQRRVTNGLSYQHADDPEWFKLDDDSELEDIWRLRYDAGIPEPVKPPVCGNFF